MPLAVNVWGEGQHFDYPRSVPVIKALPNWSENNSSGPGVLFFGEVIVYGSESFQQRPRWRNSHFSLSGFRKLGLRPSDTACQNSLTSLSSGFVLVGLAQSCNSDLQLHVNGPTPSMSLSEASKTCTPLSTESIVCPHISFESHSTSWDGLGCCASKAAQQHCAHNGFSAKISTFDAMLGFIADVLGRNILPPVGSL